MTDRGDEYEQYQPESITIHQDPPGSTYVEEHTPPSQRRKGPMYRQAVEIERRSLLDFLRRRGYLPKHQSDG